MGGILLLLLVATNGHAAVRVRIVHGEDRQLAARVGAELLISGFLVNMERFKNELSQKTQLTTLQKDDAAVVMCNRNSTMVRIRYRSQSGDIVDIQFPVPPTIEDAGAVVSLQVAETLRAALLEEPWPPHTTSSSSISVFQQDFRVVSKISVQARVGIGALWASLDTSPGLSTYLNVSLTGRVPVEFEVIVLLPIRGATLTSEQMEADIQSFAIGFGGALDKERNRFGLRTALGYTTWFFNAQSYASTGYDSAKELRVLPGLYLSGEARWHIFPNVALLLTTIGSTTFSKIAYTSDNNKIASFGRPILSAMLGLRIMFNKGNT